MHIPVLLKESVDSLDVRKDGTYVDVTGGAGGHSSEVLSRLGPKGKLLVCDWDPEAVDRLTQKLSHDPRCLVRRARFSEVFEILKKESLLPVHGLLADLGVSSYQLDDAYRGFSFQRPGPLDMRADPRQEMSAADLVNTLDADELADVIYQYGEERHSRRIARAIVYDREHKKPFSTTDELSSLAERVLGKFYRHQRVHPATRLFQALRIAVNHELEEVEGFLKWAPEVLASGGRIAIISFHSLEDRLVKKAFLSLKEQGWRLIHKKPLIPSEEEMGVNPRSRSAKLRVIEKRNKDESSRRGDQVL